jgi:purine-nucleoside/S-methyl-5'-thioadenosine phosphorylase / adenosine deaminase
MNWIQHNSLVYLQFPALSKFPGFFHGIFLGRPADRRGRIETFSLGMGGPMPAEQVEKNRQRMLEVFAGSLTGVYARQVHGTQVAVWDSGRSSSASVRLSGDALVTASKAGALVIQTADCQSVILIDPARQVAANIHSGWRGSIGNIIGRTIETLKAEFQCRPQDLICGIGPSLGPCCAEFIHYRREIPQSFWRYRRSGDRFDFWRISVDQLIASGVRDDHIHLSGICTKCNQHLFFSYRQDRQTGRFAAVVGIRAGQGTST